MGMELVDVHTHSTYSADGRSALADMIKTAKGLGLSYYGVSEHFDYDYRAENVRIGGKEIDYIDEDAYFSGARALQEKENSPSFTFLVGAELGYSPTQRAIDDYFAMIERYKPDFLVNSVHTLDGSDCYFPESFEGKKKEYAYTRYLNQVRLSLEAPYDYHIVAHVGYVSRNAPYGDRKLRYSDYPTLYDDILRAIIQKGKILEVNSSSRGAGSEFLPDLDVLTRYFELGGRAVSFGSDAHDVTRIVDKFSLVASQLKKIGFTHLTLPKGNERIKIEL